MYRKKKKLNQMNCTLITWKCRPCVLNCPGANTVSKETEKSRKQLKKLKSVLSDEMRVVNCKPRSGSVMTAFFAI